MRYAAIGIRCRARSRGTGSRPCRPRAPERCPPWPRRCFSFVVGTGISWRPRRLDHPPQGNDILPDRSRTVPDTEDSPIEPTIADASVGFEAALQMESSGETVTAEPTPEEPSGDDEENVASTSEPVLQATSLQGDAVIEVDAEPTAETSSFDEEPLVSEQITPVKQGESDETESTEKIATVEPGWEAPPHNNEENPEAVSEQMPRKASLVTDELVDMDSGSDAPENKTDIGSQTQGVTWADDEVGNRIETFEKELTMPCPICSTGHVKSEQTAKDQLFYLCTSETCDFISWGKPYHLACPLCKNPFLVEITDSAGMNSLKCPGQAAVTRATCKRKHPLFLPNRRQSPLTLPQKNAEKWSKNGWSEERDKQYGRDCTSYRLRSSIPCHPKRSSSYFMKGNVVMS